MIELLVVVAVIGIIMTLAIPNLLKARRSANEASAVNSVSLIYRYQMAYKISEGLGEFTDLNGLYNAHYINENLGSAPFTKAGYTFEMDVFPSTPLMEARFNLRARPVVHSLTNTLTGTGSRDLGVNEAGGIYETFDNTPVTFDDITRAPLGSAVRIDR